MNPTTNTEAGAVADVAAKLTGAQQEALMRFDEGVHNSSDLHPQTWRALFRRGILGDIHAAGHRFFNWTDLGLAVRSHLSEQGATAGVVGGKEP